MKNGPDLSTPGKRVKHYREASGCSQLKFAHLCGCGRSSIALIEADKSDGSPKLWDRIANVLGRDQHELRTGRKFGKQDTK